MRAFIVAAGKGRRLAPFTLHKPKNLAPILNKSIFEHQLDFLSRQGISKVDIVVSIGDPNEVESIARKKGFESCCALINSSWRETWDYALRNFTGETIIIMDCDVLLAKAWEGGIIAHKACKADITLFAYNSPCIEDGQSGKVTWIKEKDGLITGYQLSNASGYKMLREIGVSVIEWETLQLMHQIDMSTNDPWTEEFLPFATRKGFRVQAFYGNAYFKDVGTWERINKAQFDILAGKLG